jgi:hypothetical protein
VAHHGTAPDHLTRLATLTNHDAATGVPPTTPEGVALLIVARAANRTITADALPFPPHQGSRQLQGAVAVVLSDSAADADIVSSVGWSVLRLAGEPTLTEAADALAQFAAHPAGVTR